MNDQVLSEECLEVAGFMGTLKAEPGSLFMVSELEAPTEMWDRALCSISALWVLF